MSSPDLAAMRAVADDAERMAVAVHERARGSTGAVKALAWSGPRRDTFVVGAADLASRAGTQSDALRALAADLRALAADAEQRLAALHRLEAAVRAELDRMLAAATAVLRVVEHELARLAAAAAVVPVLHGVEHRLAMATRDVDRLTDLMARLPPPGDLRWEGIARHLGTGALP
jgi:hypothetical protein